MLRVLLVDDEPNVRLGVKMMIPWDELGLEVIDEGEDGDDGLNKILIHDPDIVIADVKMPGMTGIQMIDAAIKNGFKGKAVILSGYSDFAYAKEAMSLGVKRFILKPVDEDELIDCLKSLSKEIIAEKESSIKLQKGSEYLNESAIKALLVGDSSVSDSSALKEYSSGYKFNVVLISSTEKNNFDSRQFVLDKIRRQLSEMENVEAVPIDLNGMLAVIFKDNSDDSILECMSRINLDYRGKVFSAIGESVTTAREISASYRSANEIYNNRFLYLHYGVISAEKIREQCGESVPAPEAIAAQIFPFMEINDKDRLEGCFARFQESLCKNRFTPEKIRVLCITTVLNTKSLIIKSVGEKKAEPFKDDYIVSQIGSLGSLHEIIELMKKEFTEFSDSVYGRTTKSTMERVVQYIHANYNQELRLEMLANIFGYNSAYLGKVFHQYMGDNFNNYLDKIRITEAKRLLAEDEYKVYEVAERVGYTNINYFHNKFKKYVGVSPLNYKKACLSGEKSDEDEEKDET
ncbi:MAG: response regulator [Oscillospiraceae bacterium]